MANYFPAILAATALVNAVCAMGQMPQIQGAQIDESSVVHVITVDPAGQVPSFRQGLDLARQSIEAGTATKLVVRPGVYRESADDIHLSVGKAADTLLIIEGSEPNGAILSGSEQYPAGQWKSEGGGVYSHDWPHQFGNAAPFWGTPGLLGHRRELVLIDGVGLEPRILEKYNIIGRNAFAGGKIRWEYKGFDDPKSKLLPGSFGIAERDENGKRIYIRPESGELKPDARIEVAVRRTMLDITSKRNLVLRNLTFEHFASADRSDLPLGDGTIVFASDKPLPGNVLIENCNFRWNATAGLAIGGDGWTVRNCRMEYNGIGGMGIGGGKSSNIVLDGNTTNFNCWRNHLAGDRGWFSGGVKVHETDGIVVRRHTSIGNALSAFWFDVHNKDVGMEDCVFLNNAWGFFWELSAGPFYGNRIISGGAVNEQTNAFQIMNVGQATLTNSILFGNGSVDDPSVHGKVAFFYNFDRDDPHAKMKHIQHINYTLDHCILLGGPKMPVLLCSADYAVKNSYGAAMNYIGQDNTFFSMRGTDGVFEYPQKPGAHGFVDLKDWQSMGHDSNSKWQDPRFRDPLNWDFRFADDSPMLADAKRYPQYVMPVETRQAMDAFFRRFGVVPYPWPFKAEE